MMVYFDNEDVLNDLFEPRKTAINYVREELKKFQKNEVAKFDDPEKLNDIIKKTRYALDKIEKFFDEEVKGKGASNIERIEMEILAQYIIDQINKDLKIKKAGAWGR